MITNRYFSIHFLIILFVSLFVINCGESSKSQSNEQIDSTTIPSEQEKEKAPENEKEIELSDQDIAETTIDKYREQLIGCWKYAHADQRDPNLKTYLECTADFPPSRFRNTFTLNDDGKAEFLVLSANDKHFLEDGTWNLESSFIYIRNQKKELVSTYKIRVIEKGVLMLEELD